MHDTGTVGHGNVVVAGHIMALLALFCRSLPRAGKKRLVLLVFQVRSHISLQYLVGRFSFLRKLSKHRVQERLRHIVGVAVGRFHLHISLRWVHAQRHVGRKRPGRGRPCQEVSVLAHHLKAHHRGTLLDRLIALGYLMGGKRRTAARAVGHDLKAFIQKPLVPDLLERPPLGLDKIVMISHVRVVHVRPETNRAGEILPHTLIFPDRFLTFADKRIQTVLLDLLLAVQSQKLLHLQFHRQSVGIPPRLAGHHIALHGAVTGDHILDHTGQYMSDMRLAVGRRRAVIECVRLPLLPGIHALSKDVIILPELTDFLLPVYKIEACVYFLIHNLLLS